MKKFLMVLAILLVCFAYYEYSIVPNNPGAKSVLSLLGRLKPNAVTPMPAELQRSAEELARSAVTIAKRLDGWNGVGTGKLSATSSGSTVTIKGAVEGAKATLGLYIPTGVTIIWQADLTGSLIGNRNKRTGLLEVAGGGVFEVVSGKIEQVGYGRGYIVAIYPQGVYGKDEEKCTVIVSGGTVSSTGDAAIHSFDVNSLEIRGGTVSGRNTAIVSGRAHISGGTIISTNGYAILASGSLKISGGTISSTLGSRTISAADAKEARPVPIEVSGGTIESNVDNLKVG